MILKLSIIIPCYNEDECLNFIVKSLLKLELPMEKEIIIVDDGSRINQKQFIEQEIYQEKVKFFRIPRNQGKGVSVRMGLKKASGDWYLIQDADLEYDPGDIPNLLKPIIENKAKVVYGSRLFEIPPTMSKSHLIGNIFLTKLTNFLFDSNLTDMETGYKLFSREVLKSFSLDAREFELEPELTAKIILSGYPIKEIPINYKYREKGTAKINIFDGLEGAFMLIKLKFFADSKVFDFFYKLYKFHLKGIFNKIYKLFTQ